MTKKEVSLKVVEALQDDAYKGIARIDSETMKELEIRRGDIIVIRGNRETVAIADRAYPADVGERIIRIDGISRRNAKAAIGEVVHISKADVKEAKKITIAPAQKGIMVQADPDSLRRGLLARAVVKGDVIVLGGVQRRRDLISDELGDLNDIFGNLGDIFEGMGMGHFGGITQIKFVVVNATPNQPVYISENTDLVLNSKAVDISDDEKIPEITYEDIGGLSEEIKKIREMVEIPLKRPEIFERLGIEPPKGVLLHGPPGTGKTLLAKAVANESDANFILLNGPEIMSKFYGESEKKIRDIFEEAEKTAPAIIFIDEIDAIAPKREEVTGEVERRVVSQILTMMDGLKSRGKVIVIGATNRVNAIDPALRRPGRFDREIEISVPGKEGRLAILKIHTRGMPLIKDVNLEELASITHGFVGADLEALAKEAAINVLRKVLPDMKIEGDEPMSPKFLEKLVIRHQDFLDALKVVRPSAMREVLVETPNVSWNDVGGLDNVKQELIESVEWPLKFSDSYKRMGIKPSKGILLYGPPGTGKTLLAKAVAKESEANFIQVKGPSLLSMWVGKSEEGVRKIFERARQVAPCVIFFDEIDALAGKRGIEMGTKVTERVLNQILAEMDGIVDMKDILIIGATNRPDMLDPAILRPGRFDKILLVNAPGEEGRLKVLKIHTKNMPLGDGKKFYDEKEREKMLDEISKMTEGYTGADLEALSREAALIALRESISAKIVKKSHFEDALKKVKPSVSKSVLEIYKKVEENFLKSARASLPAENSYLG
jgi:transitional endoplasmic reticulum ATPase